MTLAPLFATILLHLCGELAWNKFYAPQPVVAVDSSRTTTMDSGGNIVSQWEMRIRSKDAQAKPLRVENLRTYPKDGSSTTELLLSWNSSGPMDLGTFGPFRLPGAPSRALQTFRQGSDSAFTDTFLNVWTSSTRGLVSRIVADGSRGRPADWLGYLRCSACPWDDSTTFDEHGRVVESRSCGCLTNQIDSFAAYAVRTFQYDADGDRFARKAFARANIPSHLLHGFSGLPEDTTRVPGIDEPTDTMTLFGNASTPDSASGGSATGAYHFTYRWSETGSPSSVAWEFGCNRYTYEYDDRGRPTRYDYECPDLPGTRSSEVYAYDWGGLAPVRHLSSTGGMRLRSLHGAVELELGQPDEVLLEIRRGSGELLSSTPLFLAAGTNRIRVLPAAGCVAMVRSRRSGGTLSAILAP